MGLRVLILMIMEVTQSRDEEALKGVVDDAGEEMLHTNCSIVCLIG